MSKKPASVWSGLESKQAQQAKNTKRDDRPKLARYPKPLREMLDKRIRTLEFWLKFNEIDVSWKEALDDFRNNVHMGITNPFYVMKYRDCGDIVQSAWLLDEAFAKLHEYRPEDYLTEGVVSVAGRYARTGKTDADTPTAEYLLRKYCYAEAPRGNDKTPGTKGWIKAQVMSKTSLSKSAVDHIAGQITSPVRSQKKAAKSKLQKGIATS